VLNTISRVRNRLDPARNSIDTLDAEEAARRVASGDPAAVAEIEGSFAIVACDPPYVRMARTLDRPMRYFLAKAADGPELVVSDRIDDIAGWLRTRGMEEQFHPSYTRMVPAHYLLSLHLVGCPDPEPSVERFFSPPRGVLPADLDLVGERYVGALATEIESMLRPIPADEAIGVAFSGGIDSGAVFLLVHHAMLALGMSPARLKAFTLHMEGGPDLAQAREFLEALDLALFLEPIEVSADTLDRDRILRVVEDYKPLDLEAAAMNLALLTGVRARYPEWRWVFDGDGGDENLKDYPIEASSELTIRSVLGNPLLYQEGWGVGSIKHSLTYSGGQSRACTRGYAPAARTGFQLLSPHARRPVVAVAEAIPFVELTDWRVDRLYALKGEIVRRGIRAITGREMPVFPKRRFQHGALAETRLRRILPLDEAECRRRYHTLCA